MNNLQENLQLREVTDEMVEDFFKKSIELEEYKVALSDKIKECQTNWKEKFIEITDEETGKIHKVEEYYMWFEVKQLGWAENRAAELLEKRYPELWDMLREDERQVADYRKWQVENFGFDIGTMNPRNILTLMMMVAKFVSSKKFEIDM